MTNTVDVGIVGATGYTGEELCSLLAGHPGVRVVSVTSRQHAGKSVTSVIPRLGRRAAWDALTFIEPDIDALLASDASFFFLALPHGQAAGFASALHAAGRRVLDLSADFRLRDASVYQEFYHDVHPAPELLREAVYGLPEVYRDRIRDARLVACPGCYPTSILIPLLPLLRGGLVETTGIHASCISGVSGAGRKAELTLLFAECNESVRAYGVPKHRHLSEIEQELSLAAREPVKLTFVPHLMPVTRGMHTTLFLNPLAGEFEVMRTLRAAYADEPFVRVGDALPDTKHVVGSNFCDVTSRLDLRTGSLMIFSAIDNLTKGAAGQAVQNFNIMAGFEETTGLRS